MFDVVLQVLLAIVRATVHTGTCILLYKLLSRICSRWLGLPGSLAFFAANYCISKIFQFFEYLRFTIQLRRKKPEEKIVLDELSWAPTNTDDQAKFEADWKLLVENDRKTSLSSIVDVPFQKGWLFFVIIVTVDYQINNSFDSYIGSISRTIGILVILISGAAIRYQTLFERDRDKWLDLMVQNDKDFERSIVYSKNTVPIASVGLQVTESSGNMLLVMKLYQLNSKFNDYLDDIADYTCKSLIDDMKSLAEENKKSIRLIWPLPSCKSDWKNALKANKFALKRRYKDFSFMPFVHSYVEQYEYVESAPLNTAIDETKKTQ